MPSTLGMAGDVAAAAIALAGLILVFIGAISTSFDSYQKPEQAAVRSRYQQRAWFAFGGFVFALLSGLLALLGKWFNYEGAALASVVLLFVAFLCVLLAALVAVREIK